MRYPDVRPLGTRAALMAAIAAIAGCALASRAQAQVVVSPKGDTIRVFQSVPRALRDSVDAMLRAFERQPIDSPRMRQELEALVQRLGEAQVMALGARGRATPDAAPRAPQIYVDGELIPPSQFARMSVAQPKGWLGITFGPAPHSEALTDDGDILLYFDYPSVMSVDPDSPAEGAGIMRGDTLVAYDGVDIRGRSLNMTQILQPERRVSLMMRRNGQLAPFSMTVAKAPMEFIRRRVDFGGHMTMRAPEPPKAMVLVNPNGMFGAHLTTVTPELAAALNLRTGVLVTDAPESAPAYRAGLRSGDVIVAVDDSPVKNLAEVGRAVAPRVVERSVTFRVIRKKKERRITVRW